MSTTIKTYVRYFMPGVFMPEEGMREVPERNPYQIAQELLPSDAYAFEFFDKLITTVDAGGEEVRLASSERNRSGRFYIDPEKLTAADVEAMGDDHRILLSNMRANGWLVILRCRTGNFQPLNPGDSIITIKEPAR